MTGKALISKTIGNKFWPVDSKRKNSKGKKPSWAKAEAKRASRKIRKFMKSFDEIFEL